MRFALDPNMVDSASDVIKDVFSCFQTPIIDRMPTWGEIELLDDSLHFNGWPLFLRTRSACFGLLERAGRHASNAVYVMYTSHHNVTALIAPSSEDSSYQLRIGEMKKKQPAQPTTFLEFLTSCGAFMKEDQFNWHRELAGSSMSYRRLQCMLHGYGKGDL